jgi:hypothetical protein
LAWSWLPTAATRQTVTKIAVAASNRISFFQQLTSAIRLLR